MKPVFIILIAAVNAFAAAGAGQEMRLKSFIANRQVTIGDPLDYTVTFVSSGSYRLLLPEKEDELGQWTVRERVELPSKDAGSRTLKYTLTAFTTGETPIPEQVYKYVTDTGEEKEIKAPAIPVRVESVLARYGDAGDIRDIKPPVRIKPPLSRYLWWLIALAAVCSALYYLYRKYVSRKTALPAAPAMPPEPPYAIAMRELEKLQVSGLISEGRIKEYYIALFDIVRTFLSGVYGIDTRERTSGEIYRQLRTALKDRKMLTALREFFEECDLVKFAKYRPDEKICMADLETARNMVENINSTGVAIQR